MSRAPRPCLSVLCAEPERPRIPHPRIRLCQAIPEIARRAGPMLTLELREASPSVQLRIRETASVVGGQT